MNPLPLIAPSNIADLFTKSLSAPTHQRFLLAIGDNPTTPTPTTLVVTATCLLYTSDAADE